METLFGKALNDIANLVIEKWYAGMGLVGLLLVAFTLLNGTPYDEIFVVAFGMTMMCLGFAESETRYKENRKFTKTQDGYETYAKLQRDNRKITVPGIILYLIGFISLCVCAWRIFEYFQV